VVASLVQAEEDESDKIKDPWDINRQADGKEAVSVYKGSNLLEADPSSNYERAIRDFALEMVSNGRVVFVFTSRGSPAYLLLREVSGIRFFILSDASYPKAAGDSSEVMVPRNDYSVLLNVIDETVTKTPGSPKSIIFDNVSSIILDAGLQESYKFLRQANELVSRGDIISLFIVLSKAHDEKTMNLIKNLYTGHLVYDASGLKVIKKG
jgi:KaiC/GvpD/RAD55 family RecA-like ATPase